MHVISFKRIREFFSTHRDAESSLTAWYKTTKKANWQNLAELKQVYPSADLVDRHTVFNIGGNKYRLVTRILYASQKVFILKVMTHAEYDRDKWKEECGCFTPPPKAKKPTDPPSSKRKRQRR